MMGTSLVGYSSSDDSENEEDNRQIDVFKTVNHSEKEKLPLPGDILKLFSDHHDARQEDPSAHGGRLRTFPHVEGNWATLIYAEYEPVDEFDELQSELLKCLRPLEFHTMDSLHLSLSRTVVVRHHWIKDMKDSLQEKFATRPKCACEIDGVAVLTNDEKSRSFLALKVTSANNELESYVTAVDECFQQYNLQKYYQPPLFHISIAWCLDDVTDMITSKMKTNLQERLQCAFQEDSDLRYFCVDKVCMKTGNKQFSIPVSQSSHVT